MSEKLSVLHLVAYYPPDRIGGVGEFVRILHQAYVALGMRSEVVTSGSSRSDPSVHRVAKSPFSFFLQVGRVLRLARRFDVVHAHHGESVFLLLLLSLLRQKPRIVVMLHVDLRLRDAASNARITPESEVVGVSPRLAARLTTRLKASLDRLACRIADAVVVETHQVRTELSDFAQIDEVQVIPYGIRGISNLEMTPAPAVDLLYVGTPGPRKRTFLLPAILSEIKTIRPATQLRVVGFAAEDDVELLHESERLGVKEDIHWVGPITSDEVVAHYRAASVLLMPSAYEGLPLVLLEAMREGLPAVATRVSGHPDAIDHGVNGYLVPKDDVLAMASFCVDLLNNPEKRLEFGRAATATIRTRFSLEMTVEAHLRLYGRLVEQDHLSGRIFRRQQPKADK